MAIKNNVSRKCERLNKINRNVKEHFSSLNVNEFFARVESENFLIHGGYYYERNQILESAMIELSNKTENPIIILNSDYSLENALIKLAIERKIHKITISSSNYKNYDLFANMNINHICEIFKEKDLVHNGNGSDVYAYTKAFVNVLETKYSVCLRSLLALSKQSDDDVYKFGKMMGANNDDLRIIQQSGSPGIRFRNYLRNFELAFNHIISTEVTNYNLFSALDANQIYLIDCNSDDCNSFNLVLTYELKQLLNRGVPFTLIINNVYLENNDPLVQTIQRAKSNYLVKVGISAENVISWARNTGDYELLISDFPIQLLLNTKSIDSVDVEYLLHRLGKYHHYEPTVGVHTKLFRLPWQREVHHGMIQYERDRVTILEFGNYKVLAKGHNDEIDLYIDFK